MSNELDDLRDAWARYKDGILSGRTSAWTRGVLEYGDELMDAILDPAYGFGPDDLCNRNLVTKALLNGASDWHEYSEGGCSLIYDSEIAERLSTPSELKKTRNGDREPNSHESWLDVQTRALLQAADRVTRVIGGWYDDRD